MNVHVVRANLTSFPLFPFISVSSDVYSCSSFVRTNLLLGHNDELLDIKCHPDNTHVFLATNSAEIKAMRTDNMKAEIVSGHNDIVLALDVSPCGNFLVSASKDSTVRFWKLDFGNKDSIAQCVGIGEGHTESVGCVSFSRNVHAAKAGRLFAISGAREKIIKIWDCSVLFGAGKSGAASGATAEPHRLTAVASKVAHEKDLNCVEVSPNDALVASGSEDKSIRLWATSTAQLASSTAPPAPPMKMEQLGLAPRAVLKGHKRGVWCVRFSPVEKVLVSASGDKTIKIWSAEDYSCLRTFEGHTASIKQVVFINAGMQLLSAGDDATVRLWTIKTSECVGSFEDAHDGKIWAMAATPDGQRVITGGSDSVLNVWRDASAEDAEEAAQARESFLMQSQTLDNLVRSRQFAKAIGICLDLQQQRKALSILTELTAREGSTAVGVKTESELPGIINSLSDEQLTRLLLFIRDWNTHAKTSHVAQTVGEMREGMFENSDRKLEPALIFCLSLVLFFVFQLLAHVFRSLPPSRILANRTLVTQSPSLSLYSARHFQRVDKLLTKTSVIDHLLSQMNAIEADATVEQKADSGRAKKEEAEANSVLAQLLKSEAMEAEESAFPALRPPSAKGAFLAPAASSAAAAAEEKKEDEEEWPEDEDGSAWASNWVEPTAAVPAAAAVETKKKRKGEAKTIEEDQLEEERPPAPASKKSNDKQNNKKKQKVRAEPQPATHEKGNPAKETAHTATASAGSVRGGDANVETKKSKR
jgi:U3 small nucleolar RNA-associated protein 13